MKTMNKKVIFVSLLDIISIPSGNEHPVDITDFQLKHISLERCKQIII